MADYRELAEKAADLKQNHGHNCCQAVAVALAGETSLSPEVLNQLAAGFCVGMGGMDATCGALIGAGMIAGLKSGGKGTVRLTKPLSAKFKERCGAMSCRDLKGIDTGTVLCPCEDCVRNAVLAYGETCGTV